MQREVYIVAAVRTPIGCLGGSLSTVPAVELGSTAIRAVLARAGVAAEAVDEVFMGNVLSAGVGQAPARQAALAAGLSPSTPCTTVNKVCASGMKAIAIGAQSILLGDNDIVVVGGMESMSQCPYYVPAARFGLKYGHGALLDGVQLDGLTDPYTSQPMGACGDLCAREHDVSRGAQDQYAALSYRRAAAARQAGVFAREIAPVVVQGRRGAATVVDADEQIDKVDFGKLAALRPVFDAANGTVTAANASPISDGAAALLLVSGERVRALGLPVLARVLAFADAAQAPERFTTAPALAVPKALQRAGLRADQVDLFEFNEAFAVVALANAALLDLSTDRINVHGGAIALGHPLGCSGARIVVSLLSALQAANKKVGCAAICNGGGGASAIVIDLC